MLFNSLTFLVFFAVVLALNSLPAPWRLRKIVLLLASYVFYAAWNPPFVILLWISTLLDWYVVRGLARWDGLAARRLLLSASLAGNLGLLGYFKYGRFALENITWLASCVGVNYHPAAPDIILPIGISFYTFQTMSYTLDVYQGKARPWTSLLDFSLYVTFFPQLVAGPIVRAADFLPQCIEPRRGTASQIGWGLCLMVIGLFEKVVVADGLLAPVAEYVYDGAGVPGWTSGWIGTLAFSGQIFCDFSGYSTCAIGAALCLGFTLCENFHCPYAAVGFSDFWRRWHISLSTFLRDFLYIPLGGNRGSPARTYANLMITMLLGGLWHGASWTFVAWGGLHGLYLSAERAWRERHGRRPSQEKPAWGWIAGLGTYLLVCVTWVFFRARNFSRAHEILAGMFAFPVAGTPMPLAGTQIAVVLGATILMIALHRALRDTTLDRAAGRMPDVAVAAVIALLLILMVMMPGEDRAFIYFQF